MLIDGKLYVLMGRRRMPDRVLVIDVASEGQCTYRLPKDFTGDHLTEDLTADGKQVATTVHAFELRGRLCVAISTFRRVATALFLGHAISTGTEALR